MNFLGFSKGKIIFPNLKYAYRITLTISYYRLALKGSKLSTGWLQASSSSSHGCHIGSYKLTHAQVAAHMADRVATTNDPGRICSCSAGCRKTRGLQAVEQPHKIQSIRCGSMRYG
jgi:hypothetical protein